MAPDAKYRVPRDAKVIALCTTCDHRNDESMIDAACEQCNPDYSGFYEKAYLWRCPEKDPEKCRSDIHVHRPPYWHLVLAADAELED